MTLWKRIAVSGLALIAAVSAAVADPVTDEVVAQLRQQGYTKVTISRTLLGRILVLGSADDGQREIVINPNTGEILRDYFRPRVLVADGSDDGSGPIIERRTVRPDGGDTAGNGGGSGGGGRDKDDDKDNGGNETDRGDGDEGGGKGSVPDGGGGTDVGDEGETDTGGKESETGTADGDGGAGIAGGQD